MAYEDEIEDKFIVIKYEDVNDILNTDERVQLLRIMNKIAQVRHNTGKNFNTYVVINTDEPYMPKIKSIMLEAGHWG